MPKLEVVCTKEIDAPAQKIFQTINHLEKWKVWSPWLILEPEARADVSADGKYHEWEGKRIGAGNLRIVNEEANKRVDYDLVFLKPWKSKSKTRFELVEQGDKTTVTWSMDSSLPFFLFWMKKMMTNMISMDFDRGLTMLKESIEKGKVECRLDFEGESAFSGFDYIGIKKEVSIDRVASEMEDDFSTLFDYAKDRSDTFDGHMFSQYLKWDFTKKQAVYIAGLGIKKQPDQLPENFITGHLNDTKVYTVKHTGPYHHLGNAWSAIMSMQQAKEIKPRKGYPPFELYVGDPRDTKSEDLVTEIKMPLK